VVRKQSEMSLALAMSEVITRRLHQCRPQNGWSSQPSSLVLRDRICFI